MIYLIVLLLLTPLIIYIFIKDEILILKIISITSLISSILLLIINYIIKLIISSKINFINTSKIITSIQNKFFLPIIILLFTSILSYILSKITLNIRRNLTNINR